MKRSISLFCIFFLITTSIYSQKAGIKIRQSFQSSDAKAEPATVTYTKPKDKAASYLVDGALGISLPASDRQTVSGFFEYHRNTLADEVSNTIQAGATYELYTNKNYFGSDNKAQSGSTTLINATAKYSDNKIKHIQSFQLSGEITRLYAKGLFPRGSFLPNAWNQTGKQLAIEYFPSLGFEYEGRIKTKSDLDKGNIFRGVIKLDVSVYPFSTVFKNEIELFSNFHYRRDLINTISADDRTHPSIEAGASFVLYRKDSQKISLGASYNNIDNPGIGQEKQNFWLVALKVKY